MNTFTNKALSLNKRMIKLASKQKLSEASCLILNQAIELCPKSPASHQNLGAVHMMRHKLSSALKCFLQALKFDPTSVKAHFNIANIYRELNDTVEAIRHLKVVISIDQNHHLASHQCSPLEPWQRPGVVCRHLLG
jgi:tetratricopeptide (TPR) repeat protein